MAAQTATTEVLRALNALYQGTSAEEREQANSWLQQFQRTTEAWGTADAILGSDAGIEAKVFAAQTLRAKIMADFSELGAEGASSLRDALVEQLRTGAARPVVTQLVLGLADMAVQLEDWADPMSDVVTALGDTANGMSVVVEFVAVLPEEALNERIAMDNAAWSRRTEALLGQRGGDVAALLARCLGTAELREARARVLGCLASWVRHGDMALAQVQGAGLAEQALAGLQGNADEAEAAADAVCALIWETRADNDDDAETAAVKDTLVQQLAQGLAASETQHAVAESESWRVLAEAGEAWVGRIVADAARFAGVVQGLVECMRHGEREAVAMTFTFWDELADRVLETASCDPARRALSGVYAGLVDAAAAQLRYPDDTMTAEERDIFREFRHGVGDVLKASVRVCGAGTALGRAYALAAQPDALWQDAEAALFAVRAMGAEIPPDEEEVMPQVMDLLPRLPPHPRLRYAATLVIARYTEWTRSHAQYVPFQLDFIAAGMSDADVAAASAQALKFLCMDCAPLLATHWRDLLHVFGAARDDDAVDVAVALAHVAAAAPDAAAAIEAFSVPLGSELGTLVQGALDNAACSRAALLLDRLGAFLRYVDAPDSAADLVARIVADAWPLAHALLHRVPADTHVSESASKFVRVLVEFYSSALRGVVPQVCDAVAVAFEQTGLDVYLWLARRIVAVAPSLAVDETAALQLAATLMDRLSAAALPRFEHSFSEAPDTTEEFFRLLQRALEQAPSIVAATPTFPAVFRAAIAALTVNSLHAQLAVLRAWVQMLAPARRHIRLRLDHTRASPDAYPLPTIVSLCAENGFELARALLLGLLGAFDREVSPEAADALASLAAVAADGPNVVSGQSDALPSSAICDWAAAILPDIPDSRMPPREKHLFASQLAELVQARMWPRLKTMLLDTAAACWRRSRALEL
ncbi:Nuclear import receptor [Coemansia sp. RSA 1086]|nr:Nuclear import receptor [Coemansia sp. RSA 1086]